MNSKFIIINEWDNELTGGGSEIIAGQYYDSESEAWDALAVIAESAGQSLPKDETSVIIAQTPEEYEAYYIEELLRATH